MIKHFSLILLCSFISLCSYTQKQCSCTDDIFIEDWSYITVTDTIPDGLDKIIVVTNRPFTKNDKNGVLFPNEIADYRIVTYLEVACSGNTWFVKQIQDLDAGLDSLPDDKDILLFVHGHGKDFLRSVPRAYKLKKRYDVNLILFDWPARNRNFNKSLARVRRCSGNFYNLLLDINDYKKKDDHKNQKISIIAHSLGNYFLTHMVVNGNNQYLQEIFIDNLILFAPAIRSKEHGEALSQLTFAKNKYVTINQNDRILRGAHSLTSGKMLGNFLIQPYASNTEYIHFTPVAGKEHTYFVGYYEFEDNVKAIFPTFNSLFHGIKPSLSTDLFEHYNQVEFICK